MNSRTPAFAAAGLTLALTACTPAGDDAAAPEAPEAPPAQDQASLQETNLRTAEAFIDAFYSFDAGQLGAYLESANESAEGILYYQGWADGGNYIVLDRQPCTAESAEKISCPVTVQDDPVVALKTGFNVTDTFHLTFTGSDITAVETSSNDQPIYYEARQWVEANMPEVMTGPCANRGTAEGTPADCARAMTEGYQRFYAAVHGGADVPANADVDPEAAGSTGEGESEG